MKYRIYWNPYHASCYVGDEREIERKMREQARMKSEREEEVKRAERDRQIEERTKREEERNSKIRT